jgi:hypothetical protein
MLVPHGRENTQFGEGGLAANYLQNAGIFIWLQAMRGDQFVSQDCVGHGELPFKQSGSGADGSHQPFAFP